MDEIRGHTAVNRASWDAIAVHRPPAPAEFFTSGGSTLDDIETELLPDVAGRSMLHLACANGNDSLSWAARGARVTGVDISAVAVGIARDLASQTGLTARFTVADMFDLPADLGLSDVVYASWGVVCWVPDLDRWLRVVASHLKPGGTFALFEHHPLWEILGVRGPANVEVTADYFGRTHPADAPLDQPKRPAGSTPATEFRSFLWPIGDVVTAVLRAGLVLDTVVEQPVPEMWAGLDDAAAARLPAVYAVIARRP